MKIWNRFYVRISLVFLVLIVVLAAMQARIASDVFDRRRDEIDQRANRMLAADMAREIAPYMELPPADQKIGEAIHYMMVLNPVIEIYILDDDGSIRSYFADSKTPVQTGEVDLIPIGKFLDEDRSFPVYGDDPRRPDRPSTFSVAPIASDSGYRGYLYVVLRSSLNDSARNEIATQYYNAALMRGLLYTLPLVAVLGLLMFFLLTKRLRTLTDVVRAFGTGDYEIRAPSSSRDEIGDLAGTFNAMAKTIEDNLSALEKAETTRRDLVANISHDLRTPLAAISGYTETLLDKGMSLDDEQKRKYLEISLDSVATIRTLVDDLFRLSRLEARGHVLEKEPFSLAELCQDVVMQLAPIARKRRIALSLAPPQDLYRVAGDISQIERVLMNLIDNSLRFAPEDTAVTVVLDRIGTSARVKVIDIGPGLSEEQSARVFDRFFTGDPSRSTGHSGLGLAIARRIVELHDGQIGVESVPGKGSSFYFTIPLLQR